LDTAIDCGIILENCGLFLGKDHQGIKLGKIFTGAEAEGDRLG
jgi:hypothetical protein